MFPERPVSIRAGRTAGQLLFLFVLIIYGTTSGGSLTTTDAVVTFEVTRSLVEHRSVSLPANLLGYEAHRGADGRYYSPFGIAQSVYNVPFYILGREAARFVDGPIGGEGTIPKAAVALGNTFPMAACAWVVYLFAWRLSGSAKAAVSTALVAAFATPAWPYARFGFNVPLSALTLTLTVYLAWLGTRASSSLPSLVCCGAVLGLAMLTRHELALASIPVLLWIWRESQDARTAFRRMLHIAVGVLPAASTWLAYNYVRFHHPLDAGYLRDPIPAFGSSMVVGLYGLLLSPTAALFVYAPLTALCLAACWRLARRDMNSALLLVLPLIVFLVFYAQLGNWMGGRSYGPRYLVPALPLCVVPLACWFTGLPHRPKQWLRAACAAALVAQLPGVLVDYGKVSVEYARTEGAPTAAQRLWDWRRAPIVLNTRTAIRAIPANLQYLAGTATPPPVQPARPGDRDFSQQFAYSLDFWWLYLFHMRVINRWMTAALVLIPLLAAVCLPHRIGRVLAEGTRV